MSVKITGRQWREFWKYVESDDWSYDGWIALWTIKGTVNGKEAEAGEDWDISNIDSGSRLVITAGDIMEGESGVAMKTADLVQELKKHFCKL